METLNNVAFECIFAYCTVEETRALALVNRKISSIVRQYRYRTYYWNIYFCNYEFVQKIAYVSVHGDYNIQVCTMLNLLPPNIRGVFFRSMASLCTLSFHSLIIKYQTDEVHTQAFHPDSNLLHLIYRPHPGQYRNLNIPKDCKLEMIDIQTFNFKGHITIEAGNTNLKWIRIPFYIQNSNWLTRNCSRVKVSYKR